MSERDTAGAVRDEKKRGPVTIEKKNNSSDPQAAASRLDMSPQPLGHVLSQAAVVAYLFLPWQHGTKPAFHVILMWFVGAAVLLRTADMLVAGD